MEILTPHSLLSRSSGERVLQLWQKLLPNYLPDKFGNWEPIHRDFDLNDRDAILESWTWPFLAKRKYPKLSAGIFMRKGTILQHASLTFEFPAVGSETASFPAALKGFCCALEADLGLLHVLNEHEIEPGITNGTISPLDRNGRNYLFGVSSARIQKNLPDLYWITFLGEPYVRLFSWESISNLPNVKIEQIDSRSAAICFSDRPPLQGSDWAEFNVRRQAVKRNLNRNAFFDPALGAGHAYNVPAFVWRVDEF